MKKIQDQRGVEIKEGEDVVYLQPGSRYSKGVMRVGKVESTRRARPEENVGDRGIVYIRSDKDVRISRYAHQVYVLKG